MKSLNLADRDSGGIYFRPEELESIRDNPVVNDNVTSTLVFKSGTTVVVLGKSYHLLTQIGLLGKNSSHSSL